MGRSILAVAMWLAFAAAASCGGNRGDGGDGDGGGGGDDDGGGGDDDGGDDGSDGDDGGGSGDGCDDPLPSAASLLDGQWDDRFVLPGVNGEAPGVLATALGPGGVLYAGGFFSHAGRTEARNVAGWSAEGGWTALGAGVEGAVTAAAVAPDGALWVSTSNWSSDFTSYHHLVLRWKDGVWKEISQVELPKGLAEPHRSGIQRMLFDTGGDLIVAGEFSAIDGVPLSHLAALRGATWSSIGPPPDAPVYALSVDGDEICAGGLFDSIGGVDAARVACWDGAAWTPRDLVDPTTGGLVRALARGPDGALHAGGLFMLSDPSTFDGGSIARWDGAQWQLVDRGLGIWDVFAGQNTPGLVRDLAWIGDELLVGGSFYNAGGTSSAGVPSVEVQHLASISPGSGSWQDPGGAALGVGVAFTGDNVFSIASAGGAVFVGGLFSSVGGSTAFNVARREGPAWAPLASPGEGALGVEGSVAALAQGSCDVYVGGSFARAGGVASANVAAFRPGAGFAALGPGLEGPVTALAVDSGSGTGDLYAAEQVCVELPDVLDCAQTRVRRWDGETWTTFADTRPGALFSLVLGADGSLHGGGTVTDDEGAGGVVRWTGSQWEPLGGGVGGVALALVDDGEGGLIAAGAFDTAGGRPARNIARWDGAAWSPLGDGVGSQVHAVASFDGRLVVGTQKGFGADPAIPLVAAWDGATWENIGAALEEGAPNPQIQELVSGGDFLVAVGQFPFLGGAALFDGAEWTVLADMNHMGSTALLRSEGLYVGGGFSLVGGDPAVGIGLLRPASP